MKTAARLLSVTLYYLRQRFRRFSHPSWKRTQLFANGFRRVEFNFLILVIPNAERNLIISIMNSLFGTKGFLFPMKNSRNKNSTSKKEINL
jgi:hypothetical protein